MPSKGEHRDKSYLGGGFDPRFITLFNQYYSRLCLYAYHILSDREDAEDVVQECFTKLWLNKSDIDYSGGVATYLYSMVRNRCHNYARDNRVRKKNELAYLPDDEHTRLDAIITAETYGELHHAIKLLPGKCHQIFRMLIEGKTYGQIANELHISESTIRTQKARAISILKKHLSRILLPIKFFFGL